jgi:plastocyanin
MEVLMMRSIRGGPAILTLLALGLATLSCNTKSNPVSTADVVISIRANSSRLGPNAYSPSPDTVAVGTKVAWLNDDSKAHTSTQSVGSFTWDTGKIPPGTRSIVVAMTKPGSYSYTCSVMMHSMTGILVVR